MQSTNDEEEGDDDAFSLQFGIADSDSDEDNDKYELLPEQLLAPDNYIQDFHSLKSAIKNNLECPLCRDKWSNGSARGWKPSTFCTSKVSICTHRFASEVTMQCCSRCCFKVEVNLMDTKDSYNNKSSPLLKYGINYKAILIMQHLGMGLDGLEQVLRFLGISAGVGNKKKWKTIQDLIGDAQAKLTDIVLEENIAEEI